MDTGRSGTMTSVTERPVSTRGRPRSAEADQAITDATIALLEEEGYAAMTMQGVAARAGVSTATLYRRWTSKQDLVVAALHKLVPESETIDTGSLRTDLEMFLQRAEVKLGSDEGQLIKGIIGEAVRNPTLAQALRDGIEQEPHPLIVPMLQRAVERGEIPEMPDTSLAIDLISGVMNQRWLLRSEWMTEREIQLLIPMLVRAFGGQA
jgi:AcrR family transcriptional regulator